MTIQNGHNHDPDVQAQILEQLSTLNDKVDNLAVDVGVVKSAIVGLETRMSNVEKRLDNVEAELVVVKGLVQRR